MGSVGQPLGNVLVATDFSPAATAAIERAVRLPIAPGSTLTILHVVAPGSRREDYAEAQQAIRDVASAAGESAAAAGRKDMKLASRVVGGIPFVEIIREARRGQDELIVIGRHGRRAFREILLGSTAERVIRKGDGSILVVAARPAAPYERPLVAIDCSDTSRSALTLAWQLKDPSLQTLEVVHAYELVAESALKRAGILGDAVLEYQQQARQQVQTAVDTFLAAAEVAGSANAVLEAGDARQVILDVAARRASDLLALGTHGRSGLTHVLLGSVAEAVIRAATCDVVVARPAGLRFELP
jgi:nucleotide-binding universal stress UspA family protein